MATELRFKRIRKGWVDRYRAYEVVVNGEVRAKIKRGEEVSVNVDPGHVEIHLRIDWCKSRLVELDLAPGNAAQVDCRPRTMLTAFYGVTLGRNSYIQLDVKTGHL